MIKRRGLSVELPNKKYSIIYADPPWSYRDKALAGNRGAGCKYTVQDKTWIENLPVSALADKDCALFLWVTMPKLNEVFDLFPKWGFEYKTTAFTWIKKNKSGAGNFWGMGRWTRANAEICLLGTKGKPKRVSAYVLNDQIFLIDSLLSSGHITSEQYKGLKDAILQTTTP